MKTMNKENVYTENWYYIKLPSGQFGVWHNNKDRAIKMFTDLIEEELKMKSEHWNNQAKEYQEMLKNGQVKLVCVKKTIKEQEIEFDLRGSEDEDYE